MRSQERMDAMTPSSTEPEREPEPETPTALRLMGEHLARQAELGIMIEQAHLAEVRAHENTRRRLTRARVERENTQQDRIRLYTLIEQVRSAAVGEAEVSADGDVLAEVRELHAKVTKLEIELLEAKTLLESATAQNPNWEIERRSWQKRVAWLRGLAQPDPQYAPDGVVHPPVELPDKEAYRQAGAQAGDLHCPACKSPAPRLHPAVSGGGEVTRRCADPFHNDHSPLPDKEAYRQELLDKQRQKEGMPMPIEECLGRDELEEAKGEPTS